MGADAEGKTDSARGLLTDRARNVVSLSVAGAAALTIVALGSVQYAKDGSFWLDEASVASSLINLPAREFFGPLDGQQSFPRLYLLAIDGLVEVFGYRTLVVRALPHLFFLLATLGWIRLLHLRFRSQPALLALGAMLILVPAPWLVYGAMLKPYTLDVFAALLPFLLPDAFYERTLARGERPWRLACLALPGVLSYPYPMVLLARIAGWWLARATRPAAARFAVAPAQALLLSGAIGAAAGCIWLTDLRHTADIGGALRGFWGACLLGNEGTDTITLLDRFAFGWYDGRTEFSFGGGLPHAVLLVLKAAFLLGIGRVVAAVLPRRDTGSKSLAPDAWGSRSAGYLALGVGLLAASLLFAYPICAGRLTLFMLLPLQVFTLEGLDLAGRWIRTLPLGSWLAAAGGIVLLIAVAPSSHRDAARLVGRAPPDDLRRLLEITRRRSELPILTNSCTRKQIETLPEGVDAEVLYLDGGGRVPAAARGREVWFLHANNEFCQRGVVALRRHATRWKRRSSRTDSARLALVELPKAPQADPRVRREPPGP